MAAIVGGVLALGCIVRIWLAAGTFLNPDEAQHFLVANRSSLALAYKSSLTLAHPPLLIFILYFWRSLGMSEFMLRLPSVVAGTLFCWVFFKWITTILGDEVGMLGLIFVSLLPPLVTLSAEVRQYSLLLLFLALAGYFLETALSEECAARMALFSLSLYFAMLSHYSSCFFAASLGLYALWRFLGHRFPMRVVSAWALGQLGALALFIFLYRSHISKLKDSSVAADAAEGWLRHSYFHPGQDHLLFFIFGRTFGVFQFIFGNLAIGDVVGLCFIGGLVFLLKVPREKITTGRNRPSGRQLAILFTFPFVLNCAASLLGIYPFGGTRHSVFLVVVIVPTVCFFLVEICQQSRIRSLAVAAFVVVACVIFARPHQPYMTRSDQNQTQMRGSVTFIQRRIPQSIPLFIDVQTRMLLAYYLCLEEQNSAEGPQNSFKVMDCGGYQLITANIWKFEPQTFLPSWEQMTRTYDLKPGDSVWVVQEGWKVALGHELSEEIPKFKDLEIQSFGSNIQLFELTVGRSQASSGPAPESSLHRE